MNELNKDIETRDKIIYGKYRPNMYKFNNRRNFEDLNIEKLNRLIEGGFINRDTNKGFAPSAGEIQAFMEEFPKYKAHGYTSTDGMYLVGVEKGEPHETMEEFQKYMNVFRFSDIFNHTTMYCLFNQ